MPRRRIGRPRKTRIIIRHGGSFFGRIGSALRGANNFLRRSRLISRAANAFGGPIGTSIGTIAGTLGYGRRRRRRRAQRRRITY